MVVLIIAFSSNKSGDDQNNIKPSSSMTALTTTSMASMASASSSPSPSPSPSPTIIMPDVNILTDYINEQLSVMIDDSHLTLNDDIFSNPLRIEVDRYEVKQINVNVYYASIAFGAQSEEITGDIVKIVLNWLVSQGRKPASEWIFVSCYGYFPEKGATGQQLYRTWGSSYYDWNNDSIIWDPYKSQQNFHYNLRFLSSLTLPPPKAVSSPAKPSRRSARWRQCPPKARPARSP